MLMFLPLIVGWAAAAPADVVHLANRRTLEGIVVRETDAEVILQVAWEGYVVLDRASLEGIDASMPAERQQLLAQWHEEFLAFEERETRRREFEAQQLARGLIFYRGQWVTQEELAAIKAKNAEDEERRRAAEEAERRRVEEARAQREAELQTLTERLRSMREEQLRLQQEIISLRCWLAQPPALVGAFIRDEQGNLLRVQTHDGHFFIATPDGTHADLQTHDGHVSFTDQHGVHHDVEQTTH